MKAVCPNDPTHDRFLTVAHVSQDWIVDASGEFLELPEDRDEQTTHKPDPDNIWTCEACGAEAKVNH